MTAKWDAGSGAANRVPGALDRRSFVRLLGLGVGVGGAVGTHVPAISTRAQEGQPNQVTIAWRKPQTLGPLFSAAGFEQQVERAIFGVLVTLSDALEPTLDLAETVDISPDATSFTFTLHEGVTFSDDTPLTSADVLFTFERALDPRVGSVWYHRLQGIAGAPEYAARQTDHVAGLQALDERTVRITLSRPDAAFLMTLADRVGLGILPKHVLASIPPNVLIRHEFNVAPTVGAGPFTFVRFQRDRFVELERNPSYWGDPPAVERIFLRILQPELVAEDLERGLLDLAAATVEQAARLAEIESLAVVPVEGATLDAITLNLDRPFFQDKRIRQAMMRAIDRAGIVRDVFRGEAVVRDSPIFGPAWMGVPEGLDPYGVDLAAARKLVADAGWNTGRTVEMIYDEDEHVALVTAIPRMQAQLAEAGFAVTPVPLDAAGIVNRLITTGDFDMHLGGSGLFGADPDVSSWAFRSNAFPPYGENVARYANPRVDELYRKGRETIDTVARKVVYTELATVLNEDVASIYLWSPNPIFAVNRRLQGFLPPRDSENRLWNVERWSTTDE